MVLTFVRPFLQMLRDPIDICMQCESRKLFYVDFQGYFTFLRMQNTKDRGIEKIEK